MKEDEYESLLDSMDENGYDDSFPIVVYKGLGDEAKVSQWRKRKASDRPRFPRAATALHKNSVRPVRFYARSTRDL